MTNDANRVAILERWRIGGADQWILARSEDVAKPLVLYLHGGPGTSQLTSNRQNSRALERSFIIVDWDQRGAGKSYAAIEDVDTMNIDQFVEDTREVNRSVHVAPVGGSSVTNLETGHVSSGPTWTRRARRTVESGIR